MLLFDRILEITVKSLFFSLRNYIIFTSIYVYLNPNYEPVYLLAVTAMYYAACFPACTHIIKEQKRRSKRVKVLLGGFLAVSCLLSVLCFRGQALWSYILGFLYFFVASFDVVAKTTESSEVQEEIKLSIIALLVMLVLTFMLKINDSAYADRFYEYLITYFSAGVIYIARINFAGEYNTKYYDTVNKGKNMFSFNVITVILMGALVFAKDGVFSIVNLILKVANIIVGFIFSLIEGVLDLFVMFLGWLLEKLIELLSRYAVNVVPLQEMDTGMEEQILESSQTPPPGMEYVQMFFKAVGIIIAIFITVRIAIYIYHRVMRFVQDMSDEEESEEKSFLYSGKDLLNNIAGRFARKPAERLSPVRKKYRDTVNGLIAKGYAFANSRTPNEYMTDIPEDLRADLDFDNMTEDYNDVRYGSGERL